MRMINRAWNNSNIKHSDRNAHARLFRVNPTQQTNHKAMPQQMMINRKDTRLRHNWVNAEPLVKSQAQTTQPATSSLLLILLNLQLFGISKRFPHCPNSLFLIWWCRLWREREKERIYWKFRVRHCWRNPLLQWRLHKHDCRGNTSTSSSRQQRWWWWRSYKKCNTARPDATTRHMIDQR